MAAYLARVWRGKGPDDGLVELVERWSTLDREALAFEAEVARVRRDFDWAAFVIWGVSD